MYSFFNVYVIITGPLERIGGQSVDHAMGNFFSTQVVSIAHYVAYILRTTFNYDRLGGSDDARQGPVELYVSAYILGFDGPHAIQVPIVLLHRFRFIFPLVNMRILFL